MNTLAFQEPKRGPVDRNVKPDHTADHLHAPAPFDGASTYKVDYIKKGGAPGSRGVPSIDPWGTNLPKAELTDGEWASELATTANTAYVKFPLSNRATKDPKLQESHIRIGGGKTDYATTSDTMLVRHPPAAREGPKLTKAQLQVTSLPTGDVEEWKRGLQSTQSADFVQRPADRSVQASVNAYGPSNIRFSQGKRGDYHTTHRDDYTEKHGPGYERAKPVINPHEDNMPKGPLSADEWNGQLTSSNRADFVENPFAKRAPFDPKLQGSHLHLGNDPNTYATTSRQVFVAKDMKPGDRPALMKPDLQRSSILESEAAEFTTTSTDAFQPRGGKAPPVASMREFHRTSNVALGGPAGTGLWDTTHHHDYTPKDADHGRGGPEIDPRRVHIVQGPLDDDAWKRELTTTKRDDYTKKPSAREAAFDPKLQKTHIHLGSDPHSYATTGHQCHACCDCVQREGKEHF